MTFDDFRDKLDKIMVDFKISNKKEMKTIQELMQYLDRRLVTNSKKRVALRSLKGIL